MAGEIVGKVLAKLNRIEIVCFSVLLGTLSSALHFAGYNRETLGLFGAVAVMGVLTFFYAFQLTPKMRELREGTPGFYDLNPEHPVKKEFGKLHRFYVRLMSMNFLLGLGVFYVSLSVLH